MTHARQGLALSLMILSLGLACGDKDGTGDTAGDGGGDGGSEGGTDGGTDGGSTVDADEDGYTSDVDCDEEDPAVHPDATEICNGVDDDCDAATSELGWIRSNGKHYDDLQTAIDTVAEGETVLVCQGVFPGPIEIARTVNVVGELGPEFTVIDGGGAPGSVLSIRAGTVIVEGFGITGGTGADQRGDGDKQGGGVYVSNPEMTVLSEVWIYGNQADRGGGLFADEGVAVDVRYSIIDGNLAAEGGGLYGVASEIDLASSELVDNEATIQGGGMTGDEADLIVNSSIVALNLAPQGGGAAIDNDCSLAVMGSDWSTGDEDNVPDDVWTPGGSYADYADGVSFNCDPAGCE